MAAMAPPVRTGAAVRVGAAAGLCTVGTLRWPKAKLASKNGKIQKAANRTARVRIKQPPSQTKRHARRNKPDRESGLGGYRPRQSIASRRVAQPPQVSQDRHDGWRR